MPDSHRNGVGMGRGYCPAQTFRSFDAFQFAPVAFLSLLTLSLVSGTAMTAHAGDFTYSGFATAAIGKVMSGSRTERLNDHYDCPCFIADYGQGALYGPDWSVGQESKIGLQGTYSFNTQWSATGQVVARGMDGIKTDLEWALLVVRSLAALDHSRPVASASPQYFYSEFQDVGYAFNWARVPTDLYGWEIVNYNGVNATYRDDWKGWSAKSNFFTGSERTKDNRFSRIYYASPQDVTWKNIMGADLELNRDWLTLRFNYITSQVQQWDKTDGVRTRVTPAEDSERSSERQNIYGAAMNIDYNNWQFRSEYSVFDRSHYSYRSRAFMLALGYRWGDFLPMATFTRYGEHNPHDHEAVRAERSCRWLALRHQRAQRCEGSTRPIQGLVRPGTAPYFVGISNAISVSYDTVF